jgi:hypothetical protein
MRVHDLGSLVSLMQAMGQWSLSLLAKIPLALYFRNDIQNSRFLGVF